MRRCVDLRSTTLPLLVVNLSSGRTAGHGEARDEGFFGVHPHGVVLAALKVALRARLPGQETRYFSLSPTILTVNLVITSGLSG